MLHKVLSVPNNGDNAETENNTTTEEETAPVVVQPTADEIREHRMNRFAQQAANSTPSPTAPPTAPKQEKKRSQHLTTPTKPQPIPKKVDSSPQRQSLSPIKSPGTPVKWEDTLLSKVFGVTLQAEQQSSQCDYLPILAKNLKNYDEPPVLRTALLDQVIVEQIKYNPKKNSAPMDYLVQCVGTLNSELRRTRTNKARNIIFEETESIILNYCAMMIVHPDLFCDENGEIQFNPIKQLLQNVIDPSVPNRFLADLFDRLKQQTTLKQVILSLLTELRSVSMDASLNDSFPNDLIGAFFELMSDKEIASIVFSDDSDWLCPPDATGRDVEELTYLGRLLCFSVIPTRQSNAVFKKHFSNPSSLSRRDFEGLSKSFQTKLDTIVKTIHSCLMGLFKTLKETAQNAFLSWLGQLLEGNRDLMKLRPNIDNLSGMGLLFNVSYLCYLFCEPIITKLREKAFPKIDAAYLQSGLRIDVSSETQLSVKSKELERWVDKRNQSNIETWERQNPGIEFDTKQFRKTEKAGFTTECFFLTYCALHIGFIKGHQQLRNNLYSLLRERKARRSQILQTNDAAEIARVEALVESTESIIDCYQVHLHDANKIKDYAQFYLFAARWIRSVIDPEKKGLPLPSPSMEYGSMPEFIIEDIAEFFLIATKLYPDVPQWIPLNDLMPIFVMLIGSPPHVKNPYLRAKLLELLTLLVDTRTAHHLMAVTWLETDPVAVASLAEILMQFYIDIEKTGHHNQYVHKFTVRQDIQVVLKQMWSAPKLRQSIIKASGAKHFIHFISKVLDDALYLLEEGLETLYTIRTIQLHMKNEAEWNAQSEEVKKEKTEEYEKCETRAHSLFLLADGTVEMLQYLTTEIVKPFMSPEVVGRIANMLNFFLTQLVGPKCTDLAVENRDKYSFDPKKILSTLVDIYLNLWQPELLQAVSKDERCYSHSAFLRARDIMSKTGIRPPSVCSKIEQFANEVKAYVVEQPSIPDDFEIPPQMLDPIMHEIMSDPVKLPSGVIMDRPYIVQHLLNKETDPFTNLPLTLADLVPQTELKAEIEEFIKRSTSQTN